MCNSIITVNTLADFTNVINATRQRSVCLAHLWLVPLLPQLDTFALLADLLARLAVQTVCAGTAVFFAKARRAGATFPPSFFLEIESCIQGGIDRRQREEPRLLVFSVNIFAERRFLLRGLPLQVERLTLLRVNGEIINVLGGQARIESRPGHDECLALW